MVFQFTHKPFYMTLLSVYISRESFYRALKPIYWTHESFEFTHEPFYSTLKPFAGFLEKSIRKLRDEFLDRLQVVRIV